MKPLIATTALALVFATPAMAQTTDNGDQQAQQATGEQGFLAALEQGDILATELIGQEVYAHSGEQTQDQEAQQDQQTQDQQDDTAQTGDTADETDTAEQPATDDMAVEDTDTADEQATDDMAADETDTAEQPATDDTATDDTETAEQPAPDDTATEETDTAEQPATDDMATDETDTAEQQTDQMASADVTGSDEVEHRTIAADQLDAMETIGNVDEVILDQEGQLKAIVVGVGGFLGAGDRNVALTPDHFDLAWDEEETTRYYVIADTTVEQLEQAPEFELAATGDQTADDQQPADDEQIAQQTDEQAAPTAQQWRGERDPLMVPEVTREGFQTAEASELSADEVIGSSVYDLNEDNIGNVDDIVLGSNGETGYIVLDVGGFLGIGTHTVALGLDEVSVLHDEGWGDVRIYVDASQDQLEGMAEYEG